MLPGTSMRRDVLSAYVAAGARVLSWVVIAGIVYRWGGAAEFILIAFVRGTLGLLNYVTFGISPAIMRLTSQAALEPVSVVADARDGDDGVLAYRRAPPVTSLQVVWSNAIFVSILSLLLGAIVLALYVYFFERLLLTVSVSKETRIYVLGYMGVGLLLRLLSETPGAVLQSRGRIAFDSGCVALGEVAWVALSLVIVPLSPVSVGASAAMAYFFSAMLLLIARYSAAARMARTRPRLDILQRPVMLNLLGFGLLVTLAQLADYFYAPADYLLISKFLDARDIAAFAPAAQIDAGLLLLVSGLAAVVLPKTANADAGGDVAAIRRYYVKGTLGSLGLLMVAAVVVYFSSPLIFRIWFGETMERTQEILPLLLVCTIVGGSSAVGRSVLLGMGRIWGFSIAALLAGIGNVILGYTLAVPVGMGLRGIILGTIAVVVARCGIWMPWYVLRSLRTMESARELREQAIATLLPPDST